jgi:hypothetical protein
MPFKKGQVSNPQGGRAAPLRRAAVFSKLVQPHEKALMEKALEMALSGDKDMLKFILERIWPAKMAQDIEGGKVENKFQYNTLVQLVHDSEQKLLKEF